MHGSVQGLGCPLEEGWLGYLCRKAHDAAVPIFAVGVGVYAYSRLRRKRRRRR